MIITPPFILQALPKLTSLESTVTSANIFKDLPLSTTLREIVFPKYLIALQIAGLEVGNPNTKVSNLHKITLGEAFNSSSNDMFAGQPLDTVIFKGGVPTSLGSNSFSYCPATTKIIVPCGKLDEFRNHFASDQQYRWQEERWGYSAGAVTWTTANFIEAECLNTLKVTLRVCVPLWVISSGITHLVTVEGRFVTLSTLTSSLPNIERIIRAHLS